MERFGWTLPYSRGKTQPAGRLGANPFGLYDVYGNVTELTLNSLRNTIERGGPFGRGAYLSRSADRSSVDPEEAYYARGFRVALSVSEALKHRVSGATDSALRAE
jgi:eukaryotic-like serine/threonine-protein kinase